MNTLAESMHTTRRNHDIVKDYAVHDDTSMKSSTLEKIIIA